MSVQGPTLFDSLLELRWRDIAVPCEVIDTEGGHDLAEHKRIDRAGARQEGTGRLPYTFPVRIPFINNLFRGPQETWDPTQLFPSTFLGFLEALEDRSTGKLQHPIFGEVLCKAHTWKVALTADSRGGVVVEVTFKETTEDEVVELGNMVASGLAGVQVATTDLTDQLGAIHPDPQLDLSDEGFDDLEDFSNQLSAIGDQAELLQNKVVGKIDSVVSKVQQLADTIDKTASVVVSTPNVVADHVAALGPAASRVVESCNRLNFALIGLKSTLTIGDRPIAFYETKTETTVAQLAQQLKNKVGDIITLNPLLAGAAIVQSSTPVRYYTDGGLKVSSPFAA